MAGIDTLILLGAALLVASILSSKLSGRIGVPTLIIFMAVGMLAGRTTSPSRTAPERWRCCSFSSTILATVGVITGD
jgi:hypothetical protein